ncbi:MAG: FAD-binding protein [Micrococcales bacterium]|nr:FAD-binding protein [Micrococcales bacterium]
MTDLANRPAPPAPTTVPGDAWATLAATLDGALVRPGDPDWDDARRAWHLDVDQHPAAVVAVESAADVAATMTAARALGLRVAPQSTGHNAAPIGDLHDTVLLRTHRLRSVRVDPLARVAHVGGGAVWGDVTPVAAAHGLAALAGSAADVGVAGYTLGGGLSWLARSHGLAADSVLALEVVTADGRLRRVDAEHDPELFWALRGGGGSFAVVTALELRLFPVAELVAGTLFFPLERAEEVLQAWREWVPTVPEAVTTVGRMLRFPPLPDLPAALAGRGWVVVEAACQLDAAEADRLLAPLRALGPEIDTVATVPVTALADLHMDPPGPVPGRGDGALVRHLPPEAVTALVRATGPGVDSPLLSVELRHLGGALDPSRSRGGALRGLDAEFAFFAIGITPTPESVDVVERAVEAAQYALAPWTRGCYLNFAEVAKDGDAFWGEEVHARLRRVKARHDPDDLIRANHPVRPARDHGRPLPPA